MNADVTAPLGTGGVLRAGLGSIALALPAVAFALAVATTSGRPAIEPIGWVAWATAALCLVLTLPDRRMPLRLDPLYAVLIGLAAGHLLFVPGFPQGHDVIGHVWSTYAFFQALGDGDLHPIWLHHLGLGMPLLLFYGPLSFYAMIPGYLAGLGAPALFNSAFLSHGAFAAAAMYWTVVRWTGDRRAAVVAAAAYAFAPYRLVDTNLRTALAESAALALLPVFLYFAVRYLDGARASRLPAAALAGALLILAHPLSALTSGVALIVWSAAASLQGPGRAAPRIGRSLLAMAAVWVLAAALAGFFTLPVAFEVRYTTVQSSLREDDAAVYARHGLELDQLLVRRAWSKFLSSKAEGEPGDGTDEEMPFYFGWVLLGLVPLASGNGRLPGSKPASGGEAEPAARTPQSALPWAAVTIVALALVLRPVDDWVAPLPLLRTLQFPWRFLGIASFGGATCAGFAVARLLEGWGHRAWARIIPGVIAGALVFDGFPYTGAANWVPAYEGLPHFFRLEANCGRRWGCWEWEAVAGPHPMRVVGTVLPPTEFGGDIGDARPGYAEYFNPVLRAALVEPPDDDVDFAAWGVGLRGRPEAPGVERLDAAPYASLVPSDPEGAGGAEPPPFERGGGRIEVTVDGRGGRLTLLEQHFAGWQVDTGGGWEDVPPTGDGLLHAEVAPGQDRVRFRFHRGRWDRLAGWLLTLVTAASLLVVRVRARDRESSRGEPGARRAEGETT